MARPPNDQLARARDFLHNANVPAAMALVDALLRKAPANPEANYLLGVMRLMAGDAPAAMAALEITLRADPRHGAALDSLGLCYLMQSRFQDAEKVLRKAVALPRAPAVVLMRLGVALLQQQKAGEAITLLQRATALAPHDADCQINLGRALHLGGEGDAARRAFASALALAPGNADALFNMGVIFLEQNQSVTAGEWFDKALAQAPRHAEAWVNLGIVRERQQQLEAALAAYREALAIEPRLAAAGNNLAHVLSLLHRNQEARAQYLLTLQHAPDFIAAHEGLALACLALGRVVEAIAHLGVTVAAEPENRGALMALANALYETGKLDEAEAVAQRALELDRDAADAYALLASLHGVRGVAEQAVPLLEDGYQRTGDGGLLGMLTFHYRQLCDWPKWERAWAALAPRVDNEGEAALGSPFWLLCEPISAQQQLTYTRAWAAQRFSAIQPLPARAAPAHAHQRVRIGYLSSDFQEHAAAYLIAEVLEQHDRSRFEIFAYSHGPQDHSPMRRRLLAACEHFVDIAWDTDDAAAQRIRDDEIDILIDIKGYTVGDRLTIMARRPCDNQVTWLGYPGTTGAPFVDYLIADPYIIRPGEEATCSERVLRMPHGYQPNDRKRHVAQPLSRQAYGLPESGFVFCCFNQTYKITPEVYAAWMRLLQRVPHSVLWLVDGGATATRNLAAAALAHGVKAEQLVFAPRRPYSEHLARYRVADLALDTFPYTSHTTLNDALWCGCPTVGLTGDTFAARVAGSILSAAGMRELITSSIEAYEALALRLATDAAALSEVRAKVVQARDSEAQFDTAQFTRDLESLYQGILAESTARRGLQQT